MCYNYGIVAIDSVYLPKVRRYTPLYKRTDDKKDAEITSK